VVAIAKPTIRVNREIRVREVRVIADDGEQLGILPIQEALKAAEERSLDLVEVAPQAEPPVCKIMDFGKYKYEQAKKTHESKKHQKVILLKEVKMRPGTDVHDYNFKLNHAKRFLGEGNKVKVTVVFRGREMAHTELGAVLLNRVAVDIAESGNIEQMPKQEGRTLMMIIAPKA
jgi:translation initiation factor IF-3